MRTQDQMLARLVAEIEEKQAFIDSLVEDAEKEARDLNSQEMEMATRARNRIGELRVQVDPMIEDRKASSETRAKLAELAPFMRERDEQRPQTYEYGSAGEYIADKIAALHGDVEKRDRVERYRQMHLRTASHQTSTNSTGVIPTPILGPVINFVDAVRPLVSALGPRQIPSGTFYRPKVTAHTAVAVQSPGEKSELTSAAMTIEKLTVTPVTYGGYVNVSRQIIDWSQPQIMDLVIQDLAQQYAIETEDVTAAAIYGTATATTGGTIDASPTSDEVAAAIWSAAGQVYTATKGAGRLLIVCSPDVLGAIGPLFAPINPVDAQSTGFTASSFGQGSLGAISGIQVVVTSGFGATKRLVVMSSAAAEVYEDRIGALQVIEPSVLGVQVAYAGYFAELVVANTGIIKIGVA